MAVTAGDRSLQETPTWAVGLVCAVFVIISILIEHGIHSLEKWFQKREKKEMTAALEKIKSELMILGFISLLISVGAKTVSKICISAKAANNMLPCKKEAEGSDGDGRRKLLWHTGDVIWHRVLASEGADDHDDYCYKRGKVPLISKSGIHQLHIFIFALAVFHVLYTVVTIGLAKAKMREWKEWELETSSLDYQFNNDPSRFRFTHETSFVRRHSGFLSSPGLRWIVAFFRQFFGSVTKIDYLTMRHGFINAHFAPNSKFNFHKYIKKSMEDDFKVVVGISIPLWTCSIAFEVLNVNGWYALSWLSMIPLAILLIVGAKLEIIIMEMAQQIQDRTSVLVKGVPIVEPSNSFFWFNRPHLILLLLHFALFQNAFELANFLWIWYEFGLESCFNKNMEAVLTRVFLGLALQILCSYITFPLYALVTQMGSHMKKAIFEEQTTKALDKWQKAAKERSKLRKETAGTDHISVLTSGLFMSGDATSITPSQRSSPLYLLHYYKPNNKAIAIDMETPLPSSPSGRSSYISETELSEMEGPTPVSKFSDDPDLEASRTKQLPKNDDGDFSFVKL